MLAHHALLATLAVRMQALNGLPIMTVIGLIPGREEVPEPAHRLGTRVTAGALGQPRHLEGAKRDL